MNQIIYTQKKKSSRDELRNVLTFFAVAIIIFGIVLTAQGGYVTAQNISKQIKIEQQRKEEAKGPNIEIQKQEESITIIIENDKPIYTVAYNWNGSNEKTIDAQAKTKFQTTVDLPIGTNILNIIVTDVNHKVYRYEKEYYVEGTGKPTVELSVTNKNQIKMKAKDIFGLQAIEYSWNNGEIVTVKPNEEDNTTIETTVDIPLGQNTLNVIATNINGFQTSKTLDIKGIKKPEVTLLKETGGLYIKVEDAEGVKEINYTLNGKKYTINSAYFGTNNKVVEYTQPLADGENYIILEAYNTSGIVTEVKGKCQYP